jgi:hypothetical protein
MDHTKFKPANGKKSDKFSINLFRFLRKHRHSQVYVSHTCRITGKPKPFDFSNPKMNQIYIGRLLSDDGWFGGKCLANILCGGRGYLEKWAFAPKHLELEDITEWFTKNYTLEGRSLWDRSGEIHMRDDAGRWTNVGNTRRCNWSGRWYNKVIEKVQNTSRHVSYLWEGKPAA